MNKGITEYEKFLVTRPLFGNHDFTENQIPIIKNDSFSNEELKNLEVVNLKNVKSAKSKENSVLLMFNTDRTLNRLWDNPYRYLPKFTGYLAICSPDYSVYPDMNINDIRFNVYRNRWFGCMLQEKGFRVITTIQWADESTYDICFSGVEKNSVIIVSTLGCQHRQEIFLKGFEEMKRVIQPSLIIVFGKMIKGMTGTFLHFNYEDSFAKNEKNFIQLSFLPHEPIFTIEKGGEVYGR